MYSYTIRLRAQPSKSCKVKSLSHLYIKRSYGNNLNNHTYWNCLSVEPWTFRLLGTDAGPPGDAFPPPAVECLPLQLRRLSL